MKEKKLTPMMQQYEAVKAQHPDCLVFFRLGDFYEMFQEDAKIAARELELTLTTRDRNKPPEEQIPMCGVPHHAAQNYLSRLTAKGYKVVICEQVEDPSQAKGLVERDITRIVTPGTVVEGEALPAEDNNFLAALYWSRNWAGLCLADISTGECEAMAFPIPGDYPRLISELEGRHPREIVYSKAAMEDKALMEDLTRRLHAHAEPGDESAFTPEEGTALMRRQFRRREGVFDEKRGEGPATSAVGGLLSYLYKTQRVEKLPHFNTISFRRDREHMRLDRATRRNLELTETLRDKEKRGSLLWVMDKAKTPMGHRRVRLWLERPLVSAYQINQRLDAVAYFVNNTPLREELRAALGRMSDLERLLARLSCGGASARELVALADGLRPLPDILRLLEDVKKNLIREQLALVNPLTELVELIDRAFARNELPLTVKEGGMIARGYDPEVDKLLDLLEGGGRLMADIAQRERERTGIKNLKVSYNRVFGYYIEISNAYKSQVPEDYIRKQTLVGGERYITAELKELEEEILTARERDGALEYKIFCQIRDQAVASARAIQQDASALATLDVLAGFAQLAIENRYVRPKVDKSRTLKIEDGRHPVVERTLTDGLFVPNGVDMDGEGQTLALITGPNMAGKSTYMRQVGLIVLMAQMGSFVPAKSATIGVVDRVFTRIGASDDLNAGQSTFMVEMSEMALILREASEKSLLLLDELGRGTSTYDGMSIARAVLEYCALTLRAKTLFATHYHELIAAAEETMGAENFNIAAQKRGDSVVFLRKILPGGADQSYGIEVSQLAGLPEEVVLRAREVLAEQEAAQPRPVLAPAAATEATPSRVAQELERAVPEAMTPIEALNLLVRLKGLMKEETR